MDLKRASVPLAALAYSSLIVSASAGALCAAFAAVMGAPLDASVILAAIGGTLFVYNLDRLRDRENDRQTAPQRTAFVERNAARLGVLALVGLFVALCAAASIGLTSLLVLAPVALLGLLHRRLKSLAVLKATYLAAAWTAVVVGLPLVAGIDASADQIAWTSAVLFGSLLANAIVSSLRDGEAASSVLGSSVPAVLALATVSLAAVLALFGPVRALLPVPALTLIAILGPIHSQLYGLVIVDGALLVGGVLAIVFAAL